MNAKYQAALRALDSADAGRRRKFVQLCSDPQTLSQYEAAVEADPEGAWAAARMLLHQPQSLNTGFGTLEDWY